MAVAPWTVSDELWGLVEPLLPKRERSRPGGRSRHPDRQTLSGILFVLHTGIAWRHLPQELGFGSGVTCCRRLDEWQRVGVWERLHGLLLERLRAAGQRGIKPKIARRQTAHGPGLGRYRWVVERTFAWLHQFRRLLVRYDRRADIHEGFLAIGCCLICWRRLSETTK